MQTSSYGKKALMSEINIVPFVDIVLVILIIFMIVSPTFLHPSFDIQLPQAESAKKPQNVRALLSIDINGTVYFNRSPLSQQELSERLKKTVQQDQNMKVVISADKNVAHGNVIALIDLIRKAGVTKFAVSVESAK